MKLFKQLLVAPAALGLLAPISASASEVNFDAISSYSEDVVEVDLNSFKPLSSKETLLSGGEGLVDTVDSNDPDGSFSETTTASFGVDFVVGAVDGGSTEKTTFDYQMGIGLETSFTGEDSLGIAIDIGGGTADTATETNQTAVGSIMGLDATTDVMTVDGVAYSFPLGGTTILVGDNTDISGVYTGACSYSAFTDYMGNCGTGSSVGVGGNGATAAVSYAFDGGFSLAGGISSDPTSILTEEGSDIFGIEAAYTGDSYGVSLAYSDAEATTYWGVNGTYSFDALSVSVGLESENPDSSDTATGFFIGLSFPEVGPGSVDVGMGTTANFTDDQTETYVYEASYSYPLNDGMTVTPGVYTKEIDGADDETGVIVKTSFSF